MLDDRQLVTGLLGSERETALAECIRRYGAMVKRTAWRITGDEHGAEDVCQAVFMVLIRKAAGLTKGGMLGPWLYRVAVMAARDMVKSQARRQRREQESAMAGQAQSKPTTTLLKGLDEAVSRLPESDRQLIVAHYFQGQSYAEVGANLGLPAATVQKHGARSVERLRKYLARAGAPTLSLAALTSLLAAEAGAAPLAAVQVAAIQAAVMGGATLQATALADLAIQGMLWAKLKLYGLIMASVAMVAVPAYVALQPGDQGLVGHYTFAEGSGSTVKDASTSGNHGRLVGGVTWTAGHKPGSKALSFDGKYGSCVKLDKDLDQWLGGTATVAVWINTRQAGVATWPRTGVTGVNVKTSSEDVQWGFLDETGRIGICVGDEAFQRGTKQVQDLMAKSAQPVNDGKWHHVALTRDATSGRLQVFVDGLLNPATVTGSIGRKTTPFFSIGRVEAIPDESSPDFYVQGLLSDVRMYNRVLTAPEIEALAK